MNRQNIKDAEKDQSLLTPAATGLAWLPQLLQTNDSIFPSGSYAHSFGLESLVQLGLVKDRESLAEFLRNQMLPLLQNVELPFVRLAHAAVAAAVTRRTVVLPDDPPRDRGGYGDSINRLLVLDEHCAALKGAMELRQASGRIGAQRLGMLRQLTPHPLLEALDDARTAGRFQAQAAVVFGTQTALAGTPVEAALMSHFYQTLAAQVSAAMKLIRLGQIGAQSLLTECLRLAPHVITASTEIAEDDIGWFSPSLDIASARHETAYTRIFIS